MKAIFTALFLTLGATAYAQAPSASYSALPKDSASHKVVYTAVVQAPGASATELYGRAAEWLARQPGVDLNGAAADPASGRQLVHIKIKQPPLSFTDTHANLYEFALAIYTKEGRYMYRIDDFTYQNINPTLLTADATNRVALENYASTKENKRVNATLADFNKRLMELIDSLNQAMKGAGAAKRDW